MEIKRYYENIKLWLNKRKYVETILQPFNIQGCKVVKDTILIGSNLSIE